MRGRWRLDRIVENGKSLPENEMFNSHTTYVFFAIAESILNKQNNYVDDYGHHSRFSNDLVICFVKFIVPDNKFINGIAYTHSSYHGKGLNTTVFNTILNAKNKVGIGIETRKRSGY